MPQRIPPGKVRSKRSDWVSRALTAVAWKRMVLRYRHHPDVFHETYRFRANGERVSSALKRHQGSFLRAQSEVMQRREVGWRMIVRNLYLLGCHQAGPGLL